MADYLRVVSPHLSESLVPPAALSLIQSLAQSLPCASVAGFECRLGSDESQVDFQLRLPWFSQPMLERFLPEHATRLESLCWKRLSPQPVLQDWIESVIAEFDMNCGFSRMPSLFMTLNERANRSDADEFIRTAAEVLDLGMAPAARLNIHRCANALPSGAFISHFGLMFSRPEAALRINLRGICPKDFSIYLEQLGWEDPTDAFRPLVSSLSPFVDYILLSLDIAPTLRPRVGLECFIEHHLDTEPRWINFLEYLVLNKLCTEAKRQALLTWPGLSQKATAPERWPENIDCIDRMLGPRAISAFWRILNHIKIVYHPGSPLEAKAYLGFGHHWFDARALSVRH